MPIRFRGSFDFVLDLCPGHVSRLPTPGKLNAVFVKEDGMKNGYLVFSTTSPNVTRRILTVDDGSGVQSIDFAPDQQIQIMVAQDATVNLTLVDHSDDPLWLDSEAVTLSFVADHRDPPTAQPLPTPGPLSVQFTGEVAG